MTKKTAKIAAVVCLALSLSAGAFAKSVYFSTSVESLGVPVYPLELETPDIVLDWFEDQGLEVDNYSTDLTGMPVEYRNEVRKLYGDEDYKDEVDAIAQRALFSHLEEGSVEYVTTSYGPIKWTVHYSQKDPFDDDSGEKEYNAYD